MSAANVGIATDNAWVFQFRRGTMRSCPRDTSPVMNEIAMNSHSDPAPHGVSYRCPACNHALPYEPPTARYDAPCCECGSRLWCRRRESSCGLILEILPQRTPEPEEVTQLVEALHRNSSHTYVIVDLSRLELVDSAFVARLVLLNKLILSTGGRLVLLGLSPLLRETFDHLRLAAAFEIEENVGDGRPT